MTLSLLSERMLLPEHKLRVLINQHLGYRNFNAFLNELRINEVSDRLIVEQDTPVSSIAMETGYRNLSSFNRLFKQHHHCTPRDYRNTKR